MNYQPFFVVVDDNLRIRENFQDLASGFQVEIRTFETWDVAVEFLDQNQNVDGLILDAKGKLTADHQESDAHLQKALKWLSKQEGQGRIIPYLIHTAFYDNLETFSEEQSAGKMIPKGRDSESLTIEKLKELVQETPKLKLIQHYPTAFIAFSNGIIDRRFEYKLVEMLECLENGDFRKKNLNLIRDILEVVLITLIDNYDFIPESFKNNKGKPNLEWSVRFMEGRPTKDASGEEFKAELTVPTYISSAIRYVKERTSEFSHLSDSDVLKTQFCCSAYLILEVLEWLPSFIENNFE